MTDWLIDAHQHNGPWPFPGRFGDVELNLHYLKRDGIHAAVISSTEGIVSNMMRGNARLAAAIAGHPELYAYVVVNPTHLVASCAEMDKYYDNPQFVAAKIHPAYAKTPLSSPNMVPLIAEIAKRGRPALIHTWGAGEVRALANLAQRWPQWKVLMAHGGGDAWREAIEVAQQTPNIYLEFCCSAVERGKVERAIAALGPERVLFGTDATLFDTMYMLSLYREANLSPAESRMVMGENALRLFGLRLP